MRQAELNRAIARATGESVSTIKRLGFLMSEPADPVERCAAFDPHDEAHGPYVIDWDALEQQRLARWNDGLLLPA